MSTLRVLILLAALPAAAGVRPMLSAQTAPPAPGAPLRVTTRAGLEGPIKRWNGSFAGISQDSLILDANLGPVRLPLSDVVGLEEEVFMGYTTPLRLLTRQPKVAHTHLPVSRIRPYPLPGTVVRIRLTGGKELEGVFTEQDADSLRVTVTGQRIAVARNELERLTWRSGRQGAAGTVTGGAVMGGMMGAMLGFAVGPDCSGQAFCFLDQEGTALLFGLSGAALGAGIGWLVPRAWRWEGAEREGPRLAVGGTPNGRAVMAVQFQF